MFVEDDVSSRTILNKINQYTHFIVMITLGLKCKKKNRLQLLTLYVLSISI